MLLLVSFLGGTWIVEQPMTSLMWWHPRMQDLFRQTEALVACIARCAACRAIIYWQWRIVSRCWQQAFNKLLSCVCGNRCSRSSCGLDGGAACHPSQHIW